jgi:hypothetical protein
MCGFIANLVFQINTTMQKNLLLLTSAAILPFMLSAQIAFIDQTSLLPTSTTFHSGNSLGVCDMNNDGKDDIVRANGNSQMFIDYQQLPNATFAEANFPNTFGSPWGMCVGDFDNNGFNDVFWGPNGQGRVLSANATGTSYTTTDVTTLTGAGSVFTQGCNFADINNDGKLDLFVCHDSGMSHIYVGNGNATGWIFDQSLMPLASNPSSDNSGNYASIFTDINADGLIDMMITHCRQGVTSATDPRRIDQLFLNNGNGTYTQDTTNWTNLRDGEQGWSTAWGDIDNDGDMDAFVLNQTVNAKMMINNGSGVFTDIMATSGIANPTSWFGENATFHDFDNDGFVDLMLSGDKHYIYHNNGNSTFSALSPDPFTAIYNKQIRGHAVGDLNDDGFLDVYTTYCNLYITPSTTRWDHLWMNSSPAAGNTNHYIKFHLTGVQSNKNGIGAIVKIYGPWGVQVREVRSGEGYGLQNSFTMHFGLGSQTQIDSAFVYWPSGVVDETLVLGADQTINLVEGGSPLATHSFMAQSLELNVYPNPVTDDAVIRLDHFAAMGLNNLSVNVYDLNGKVIYTESALQRSIIVLDRSLFSSGMYLVEVTNNDKRVATKKMIVQ